MLTSRVVDGTNEMQTWAGHLRCADSQVGKGGCRPCCPVPAALELGSLRLYLVVGVQKREAHGRQDERLLRFHLGGCKRQTGGSGSQAPTSHPHLDHQCSLQVQEPALRALPTGQQAQEPACPVLACPSFPN